MASAAAVPQIYDDWAASCEVQQRFMQNPSQPLDTLTYSGRCRQGLFRLCPSAK